MHCRLSNLFAIVGQENESVNGLSVIALKNEITALGFKCTSSLLLISF